MHCVFSPAKHRSRMCSDFSLSMSVGKARCGFVSEGPDSESTDCVRGPAGPSLSRGLAAACQ